MNKTWIIIPANNEGKNIADVIRKTKKFSENVVVVDDGSVDGTSEIAEKEGAILLKHIVNLGKGAALKTGCDYAVNKGAEKIVVLDADGQHDPKEIPNFVDALEKADIAFGQRKLNKKMPFIFRIGNWLIFKITKMLYKMEVFDTQCGYRAFTSDAYKKVRWHAADYSMESEMIANAGKHHLKHVQVPIDTIYADKYKGTTIIDGVKVVLNMVWWKIIR